MQRPRVLLVALAAAAILAVAAVVMLTNGRVVGAGAPGASELLLKLDLASHDPYSPPPNMYLWWGPSTNHRFVGSGEHIRRLLHLGQIEGGEWRSSMFLGNNGVATFRGQRFRHFRAFGLRGRGAAGGNLLLFPDCIRGELRSAFSCVYCVTVLLHPPCVCMSFPPANGVE